uniref:Reverse transcriptase domain-containing protein n=1 Tax=Oreochromis niloticus TaxID=8128 RepID=A0A669BIH3_ORENI
MFTNTDLDQYASSVLDYISETTDSVTTQKRITMYPNQKPWMNRDVRLLLKAHNTAFRSGDAHAYSTARANLKKGIKKAKHHYKKKVEEHFSNSNPRRMWQGLQTITDYRTTKPSPASSDVSFLNELNNFYARFERGNPTTTTKADVTSDHQPLTLSPTDVGAVLSRINVHKAAGPDGIPGRVLRACSGELAGVLTDIFNLSLAHAVVPACFKSTSIVPIPKNSNPSSLNDYRPVALTPIITKCLEQLVLAHFKSCLPPTLDPHQFAYRQNRSTEDAVSIALHSVLSHLDNNNTYARMLFIDFSSAFNTIHPSQLIRKLTDLGISSLICKWLLDYLTNRPQHVRLDNRCSSTITMNTGVPQGCVMSPFLYSLFTHDCRPADGSNTIIKFADDTTVIGLISDNDETAYREEVDRLAEWCDRNNLLLNTEKTKELIVDYRRNADPHPPIQPTAPSWSRRQRLFFLRTLRKSHLSSDILVNFYHCTIESILTNCITVWYGNCSASDRKALQRVVKTAQRIAGAPLPAIKDIYRKQCLKRAGKIIKDPSHPSHGLFTLLPSGRRYRSLRTKTTRYQNSFFPTAVRLLNSAS